MELATRKQQLAISYPGSSLVTSSYLLVSATERSV